MARTKLKKFKELAQMENVREFPEDTAGKWGLFFRNQNEVILELACGHGDFSLEMARRYPNKNIIAVDKKGNRLWSGAKRAQAEGLDNVCFMRAYIEQISNYFDKGEVSDIWIMFADPFLKESQESKRLTHERFLAEYKKILKKSGVLHVKTDDPLLFNYSLDSLERFGFTIRTVIDDVHSAVHPVSNLDILTYYEQKHIESGRKIYYLNATLT